MIWSCKVFYVDPAQEQDVLGLLFDQSVVGHEYTYGTMPVGEKEEELKIYIDRVSRNRFGYESEVSMDQVTWLKRRRERFPVIVTADLALQYFTEDPIRGYLGVFGGRELARRFIGNFLRFARNERGLSISISPVRFLLTEKSRELTEKLGDITKFKVSKVRDIYVASASVRGQRLQEADVYHRWVVRPEISGEVEHFGISLDERTFILSTDGVIYTAQGKERREPGIVFRILEILKEAGAIQARLTEYLY